MLEGHRTSWDWPGVQPSPSTAIMPPPTSTSCPPGGMPPGTRAIGSQPATAAHGLPGLVEQRQAGSASPVQPVGLPRLWCPKQAGLRASAGDWIPCCILFIKRGGPCKLSRWNVGGQVLYHLGTKAPTMFRMGEQNLTNQVRKPRSQSKSWF